MQPIALTLGQKFEIEKFSRDIDNSNDVQQLRDLAKDLLVAWKQQQSAAAWIMRDMQLAYSHVFHMSSEGRGRYSG